MIYFLVNNDYHLLDAQYHAAELTITGQACTLIRVPHALQLPTPPALFVHEWTFASPVKGRRWIAAWLRYGSIPARLAAQLHPDSRDTLVVYTEYELVNHFLINLFKDRGAKVFHLEDGGVGTYLAFSRLPAERLTLKERVIGAMTRMLPGLRDTRFHKINGVVFPWRPDHLIDALCLYRQVEVARELRVEVIHGPGLPAVSVRAGRVLFLNERIYDHYQGDVAYLAGLDLILTSLCRGYREVLFKFHPRETDEWKSRVTTLIAEKHADIQIVQETLPVERLLQTYAPEALASYFATTLLNLQGTGIQPLYLYHLLPDLAEQPMFRQLTFLLSQWGYCFARTWDDIHAGYESHLSFHADQHAHRLSSLIGIPTFPVGEHTRNSA
jgi:hypothetical protein